jgi:hypothetical protein
MADDLGRIFGASGSITTTVAPSEEQRIKAHRVAQLERLIDQGHEQLTLHDAGEIYWASDDGRLWVRMLGQPQRGFEPGVHAFSPGSDWAPLWFERPREGQPQTVAELEQRQATRAANAQEQADEAANERAARRKRPPPRTVTYADLHPQVGATGPPLTLRSLAERLEAVGAVIEIQGGRLYLHATPGTQVNRLAQAAHVCEAAIVAAVGAKDGAIDPQQLPPVQFTPSGALLRPDHEGRA